MLKARPWNGKDLKGIWEVTLKIDGVRALWLPAIAASKITHYQPGQWYSRANKPLYNIPEPANQFKGYDVEVYCGVSAMSQKERFKATIRAVRTQKLKADTPIVLPEHLYSLDPLDPRLGWPIKGSASEATGMTNPWLNPTAGQIREIMAEAVDLGYEGLVLRQVAPDGAVKWLKVKPEETHDVLVTGAIEGVGKHAGRLGALTTAKGNVGTGFTDDEREELWAHADEIQYPPGWTIEVSCMHFTPDGKFRHPRFIRMRPDKIAEERP